MREETHAPGWRGRPRRYGPFTEETNDATLAELLERGEKIEDVCAIGCGILATVAIGSATVAWAEPITAFLERVL